MTLPVTLGIYEVLRSETEQNLGEGRAEPWTVYPLLCVPSETKCSESAAWSKRSGEVIFYPYYFLAERFFLL